jgi:poly(A) polymerase
MRVYMLKYHKKQQVSTLSKKISEWAKRVFRSKKQKQASGCTITPRSEHSVSRDHISPNALKVLYKLKDAGHAAYLVGGGVRDVLLNRQPKDFDVATDAHPEKIRKIFRNSRIIGRRFQLVHVFFGEENIEVSTFRANTIQQTRNDMIYRDNAFGTIEEDAWRRDFTVNALYYNIADFSIVDYCGGMHDLKHRLIRMIGDPSQRYHEDPVRLIRAIRLSAKLNLHIETKTESALVALPHLLKHVPTSRLFDECIKLFFEGNAEVVFEKLQHYRYLAVLFPQVACMHDHPKHEKMVSLALKATDDRVRGGETVNPAFLFSVFLWPALQAEIHHFRHEKKKFFMRLHKAIDDVVNKQLETVMISKRFQYVIHAVWVLQFQLEKRRPSRILTVFQHRYFRAAIDFMQLRVASGEISADIFNWWKCFQDASAEEQQKMIEKL